LNCSHFYNYMGADLTCADTNDKWLAAHFSDVPRMKAIKAASDPLDTFRSRLTGHSTASTTASSTTGTCHTAVPGEECYGHAAWAHQDGIRSFPQWYPGLSLESCFEDFQRHLWSHGQGECPEPCAAAPAPAATCHTAVPGEECYGHAAWAHQEGIRSSPQWYPGLSLESSFEDFQEHLWTNGLYECERPCRQ
jgi:hypothetical protein